MIGIVRAGHSVVNSTPKGVGRKKEDAFNHALGAALCSVVSHWEEDDSVWIENTGVITSAAGHRPDLLIEDRHSPPVIVETAFDEKGADKDAIARLGVTTEKTGATVKTAIAVITPEWGRDSPTHKSTERLLQGDTFLYALHQIQGDHSHRRFPECGAVSGDVADLAYLTMNAALPKADIEAVGATVAAKVDQVANILEGALNEPGMVSIMDASYQRSPLSQLRTIAILWLNALLTQQRLHEQNAKDIPGLPLTDDVQPTEVVRCWRAILEQNWRAIYEPAVTALAGAIPHSRRGTTLALTRLLEAVEDIETAAIGRTMNVGAELFPKIAEDRKESAAFYTQAGTADLLAALAVKEDMLPPERWANPNMFSEFRVADLACGTGTLLRFAYQRVRAFHEKHAKDKADTRTLHKGAMESGIIGTDISPIATHLASSSLAAIGGGEPYGETKIGWVDVGRKGGKVTTGSLEYMGGSAVYDLFGATFGRSTGNEDSDKQYSIAIPEKSLDVVIMNPPYSRTRGGLPAFDVAGLSETDRKACQRRWRNLTDQKPCSNQAGMAASFLVIARDKVKPGGRIGFVLPLTAAFADTWKQTREVIEREFEDILAVAVAAGKALGDKALSADTKMEEMLLVGTKKAKQDGIQSPIHCVVLDEPPVRPGEATEVGRAVLRAVDRLPAEVKQAKLPVTVGDVYSQVGKVIRFQSARGQPWSPLGVVNHDLAVAAEGLKEGVFGIHRLPVPMTTVGEMFDVGPTHHLIGHPVGNAPIGVFELHPLKEGTHVLPVPMTTVGELFDVGPTHDRIGHLAGKDPRGAFEFHSLEGESVPGSDLSLWAADGRTQTRLLVQPTHWGSGDAGKERETMRRSVSTLFYGRTTRWTSQALLAASTEHKVMGGRAWVSLSHADGRVKKAFALWANSIFGMALHWTKGQRTQLGRSTMGIAAIRAMPCPDLTRLPQEALEGAVKAFDALSGQSLDRAKNAHVDAVRRTLDAAVIKMFGLPEDVEQIADDLRERWCAEPSVSGKAG